MSQYPELPEPGARIGLAGDTGLGLALPYFTTEQLHAYADAVREQCARVCEREQRNYLRSCESLGLGYSDPPNGVTLAAAIRALAQNKEGA